MTPKKHEKPKRRTSARARGGRPPSPTSLHAWRVRKESALARLRELELNHREARSLDAEAVARRWEAVGREVQARMLAVVSRVRAALPHLTVQDAEVLDREIRAALTAIAEAPCSLLLCRGAPAPEIPAAPTRIAHPP